MNGHGWKVVRTEEPDQGREPHRVSVITQNFRKEYYTDRWTHADWRLVALGYGLTYFTDLHNATEFYRVQSRSATLELWTCEVEEILTEYGQCLGAPDVWTLSELESLRWHGGPHRVGPDPIAQSWPHGTGLAASLKLVARVTREEIAAMLEERRSA